jgi:hypothetical protein
VRVQRATGSTRREPLSVWVLIGELLPSSGTGSLSARASPISPLLSVAASSDQTRPPSLPAIWIGLAGSSGFGAKRQPVRQRHSMQWLSISKKHSLS